MTSATERKGADTDGAEYWDASIETISRDALRAIQIERLSWQLGRCQSGSSLYRAKLNEIGAEPGDIRDLSDFEKLPIVTKDELRLDQAAHGPYGSFAIAGQSVWREVHPSSGTTGAPVLTLWSQNDCKAVGDFTARTLWQFGVRPRDVVQNAFAYGLWVAGMSCHYGAARIGALVIPVGTNISTAKQIEFLQITEPTVILSTPSYALHISEELSRLGLGPEQLSLRVGCFGGESGAENPATRALIEHGLGIEAYDYYGLAEIGPTFASECKAKAGLHFAEDHVLVECLDPETKQPVSDGEIGVLVFTHLTREATPLLRFWSNDYARLTHERCSCGRTHVRAEGGILGRHDDLLVFKGAKFYPGQVEKVVRSFQELSHEFRVEVKRETGGQGLTTSCTVVVELREGSTPDPSDQLRAKLRDELGVTPGVRVEPPGLLERTAFKAARIVDNS